MSARIPLEQIMVAHREILRDVTMGRRDPGWFDVLDDGFSRGLVRRLGAEFMEALGLLEKHPTEPSWKLTDMGLALMRRETK